MAFDINTAVPVIDDKADPKISEGFDFGSAKVVNPMEDRLRDYGLWDKVSYFMAEQGKALARAVETIPAQAEGILQRGLYTLKDTAIKYGHTNTERVVNRWIDTSKRLQQNWIEATQTGIEAPSERFKAASPLPWKENFQMTKMIALGTESIPMLGLAAAVTAATKNPSIGASILGITQAAEEANIAEEKGLTNQQANYVFVANALMLSALETVPLTSFMKGGKLPLRAFRTAVQEGGEEVLQQLWVNSVAKIGYDETRKVTEGLVENFLGGFISGGVIGAFGPSDIEERIQDAKDKGVDVDAMAEVVANQIIASAEGITDGFIENQGIDALDDKVKKLMLKAFSGQELTDDEMKQLYKYGGVKDAERNGEEVVRTGEEKGAVGQSDEGIRLRDSEGNGVEAKEGEVNFSREMKYKKMRERIGEIKKERKDLGEYKEELQNMEEVIKEDIDAYKNSIKRPSDNTMLEKFKELNNKYKAKDGEGIYTLNDELIDRINDLEDLRTQTQAQIQEAKDSIREETQRKVIKSEIDYLTQRLTDYKAGKLQAVKDLSELRKDLRQQVRKSPDKVAKMMLTAIDSIKDQNTLDEATQKFNDILKEYVERQKRAKLIGKIIKAYKHPENIIDVKFQKQIDDIREKYGKNKSEKKKSLKQLSTEELESLGREIIELTAKGKALYGKKKQAKVMAREIMRGALIKAAGGEIDVDAIGSIEEKKSRKQMSKHERDHIRPVELVQKLFGDMGKRHIYDSVNYAEQNAQGNKISRWNRTNDILKNNGINRYGLGTAITIDGHTFQINDVMSFYAQRNNELARKAYIEGNRINEELFNKFINELETKYKNYAKSVDEIKEVVGEKFDSIREVMEESFNITIKKEDDYFPMHRQQLDKVVDPDGVMGLDILGDIVTRNVGGVNYAAVEKGFGINRKEISQRNQMPLISDFVGEAIRAIDSQEHFLAYAPIQKMFNSVKSDKTLQNAVIYNHGEEAWKAIDNYMNIAINPKLRFKPMGFWDYKAKALRKALSITYLGFNVVTMQKQFASLPLVLKYTDPARLALSVCKMISSKEYRQETFERSKLIQTRIMERDVDEFMSEMSRLSDNDLVRGLQVGMDTIGKEAFQLLINMDRFTVLAAYDAVYQHQLQKVGEAKAMELADEALLKTQPQGRIIDLPEAYRTSNEALRLVLLFTNQLNQIYNLIRYDIPRDMSRGEYGKALSTTAGIMMSSFLIYLISHGFKFPEDEEDLPGALFDAMLGSYVSSYPVYGNLAMSFARGYSPSLSPADSMLKSVNYIKSQWENENYFNAVADAAVNIAAFNGVGIPYNQIRRTLKGAHDLYTGETDDIRRLIYSKGSLFEN